MTEKIQKVYEKKYKMEWMKTKEKKRMQNVEKKQ